MSFRLLLIVLLAFSVLTGCAKRGAFFNSMGLRAGHWQTEVYGTDLKGDAAWGETEIISANYEDGPQAVADSDGPYLLDSGDQLRVFVYGQPNLSRIYTVGHNGKISVPLIGSIKARGKTTRRVQGIIRSLLAREYVRDPQVTVDIQQFRPFFILGQVRTAGQYPYVPGMTVETAIAIAGGYTERASTRSYRVSRRVNGIVEQLEASADQVVHPGDTVFVYERFF